MRIQLTTIYLLTGVLLGLCIALVLTLGVDAWEKSQKLGNLTPAEKAAVESIINQAAQSAGR